jgi:hypothetical protein
MGSCQVRWKLGHAAAGKLELSSAICPLSPTNSPASQVIHNELDYRLPISEGLAMFNVLQARGVPSKFVMFPDEHHVSQRSSFSLKEDIDANNM